MNTELLERIDYIDGRNVTKEDIQAISDYIRNKKKIRGKKNTLKNADKK
ncbi:hypothetical protein [Bacteroides sp. 519]|nr:hypothetical protein [Bacteroides sp. 519]